MTEANDALETLTNLLPKLKKAWGEISQEPFNPDLNTIKFLLEHGVGFFHSERVGFYGFTVGKHLLTSVNRADVVTVYVYPQYRGTLAARRLMSKLFKHAKTVGAAEVYFAVPTERENVLSWSNNYGPPIDFVFKRKL